MKGQQRAKRSLHISSVVLVRCRHSDTAPSYFQVTRRELFERSGSVVCVGGVKVESWTLTEDLPTSIFTFPVSFAISLSLSS